jgi:hypothetical protein
LDALVSKNIVLSKSKEAENGWSNFQEWTNLAEFSKEGCGSKRAVLAMMLVMMVLFIFMLRFCPVSINILSRAYGSVTNNNWFWIG